jgi:hypothetical protein
MSERRNGLLAASIVGGIALDQISKVLVERWMVPTDLYTFLGGCFRVQMVRNAVVGYLVAVTCFILTSFAIGVQQWVTLPSLSLVAVICFMIGMFSVLVGASFAVLDAWTGYKVIMIEMNDDRAGHA